jgi:phosphatidylinositol alpha-1,6-mannosyltransferase
MRPVLLVTPDFPPAIGGVASYLRNLVNVFPVGGVSVLAASAKDAHQADVSLHAAVWRRRLVSGLVRPRWLPCLYWTDWLIRKENPRHLLVSHVLPMGEMALLMKRRHKVPYSVIVHGLDVGLALSGSRLKRLRAKSVLREAETVVANSAYTANLATALGVDPGRIIIVRPSPHFPLTAKVLKKDAAETSKALGLEKKFVVLTTGRLVRRKGFDNCIEALAIVRDELPDAVLVIVGDGSDRKRLEKLALDRKLSDRVLFTGSVGEEENQRLFAACDLFVMTPRGLGPDVEGFGIVYLEANLFGKPVIGSRTGGVPDAVVDGETGLLVEPNRPKELAAAIRRLHDDPRLAADLGQRGRNRVLGEFGWARQARPLIEKLFPELD